MDNVLNTLKNLSHDMALKLLASSIMVALFYHAVLFAMFGAVVFLDLFSRWLAFFSKMVTYLLLILGASIVDYMIKDSGGSVMAVSLVITYLSMTELLSIVENLDEAGVSAMHDLIDLIKGRRM